MTTKELKELAIRLGADEVGIASMDRFEGCPIQMDPRQIMPRAKSLIAMSFRVMRGSLRGVEEGTFMSNYPAMGYGGLTYIYMPLTVINLCKYIEDEGYEAIPYGHQSDWRAIDNRGDLKKNYSRPVEEGKAHPDVMVHLRIAAYLAGLGEIGYSKMLLTPKFGPRHRIGIVITEEEFEPDPIMKPGTLCNKCMACVKECPGGCISADKTVSVDLCGNHVEWGEIDVDACNDTFRGAEIVGHGEGSYLSWRDDVKPNERSPFYMKPKNLYNSGQAICGANGCTRACMMSLEARGVISNQFHNKFRTKPLWKMDWSDYEPDFSVPRTAVPQEVLDDPNGGEAGKNPTVVAQLDAQKAQTRPMGTPTDHEKEPD